MAIQDVKITDLEQVELLRDKDLFLIAHPLYNSDGSIIENNRYTSNSLSGGGLMHTIEQHDLCVVNHWHFHTTVENIPTQDIKLETDDFISALEDDEKLSSIINDMQPGWYKDLSSSAIQLSNSGDTQSISVINNGIPNIDFVERAIAGAYQSLLNQLTTIISPSGDSHFIPTHVGEIVYSTRFSKADYSEDGCITAGFNLNDPSQATNIRQFYGYGQKINGVQYPNTKWIPHSDYFLRGANTLDNVSKNHNSFDYGQDEVKMTSNMLIQHNHPITKSTSKIDASFTKPSVSVSVPGGKFAKPPEGRGSGTSGGKSGTYNAKESSRVACSVKVSGGSVNISVGNGGTTNNAGQPSSNITPIPTLPKYKNVYIWERIA